LGDASGTRPQGRGVPGSGSNGECTSGQTGGETSFAAFWRDSQLIDCKDGKARRVPLEPALFPLAYGIPGRVGILRGAGNAIVPQVAAEFVKAFLDVERE